MASLFVCCRLIDCCHSDQQLICASGADGFWNQWVCCSSEMFLRPSLIGSLSAPLSSEDADIIDGKACAVCEEPCVWENYALIDFRNEVHS